MWGLVKNKPKPVGTEKGLEKKQIKKQNPENLAPCKRDDLERRNPFWEKGWFSIQFYLETSFPLLKLLGASFYSF